MIKLAIEFQVIVGSKASLLGGNPRAVDEHSIEASLRRITD